MIIEIHINWNLLQALQTQLQWLTPYRAMEKIVYIMVHNDPETHNAHIIIIH